MGAGLSSISTTVFYAFVTLRGAGDVDNLRILLTAMGNYHEWMSSTYLEMPSITTFASFYIGHMMGEMDLEGKIQLHFCKHHLLLFFCCGARTSGA